MKYVAEGLYNRRFALTGGEEGNGFEVWWKLFNEFEGDHILVKMGGRRLLNNYPKRDVKSDVIKHIEGWTELLILLDATRNYTSDSSTSSPPNTKKRSSRIRPSKLIPRHSNGSRGRRPTKRSVPSRRQSFQAIVASPLVRSVDRCQIHRKAQLSTMPRL